MDERTQIQIADLVDLLAGDQKEARYTSIQELFEAAAKLATESPGTLNLKIAATVLKELRYSFRLFYKYRYMPKITIFGSARIKPSHPTYKLAKNFAIEASKRDYMIITGGGPGVMAAGNEGAMKSFGLNIRLPHEQEANPFVKQKEHLVNYKYFFTRKLFLVKEASAFVLFPGGFGTLDETFEVLTLLQTGKTNLIPVVLMETPGGKFWKTLHNFFEKEMVPAKYIAHSDEKLFKICSTPKAAMDHIEAFYANYHSMRLVRDKLVVRLKRPVTVKSLKSLNENFRHLSPIVMSPPLKEEGNEPELSKLHRLVMPFDRKDFTGLRPFIDAINI